MRSHRPNGLIRCAYAIVAWALSGGSRALIRVGRHMLDASERLHRVAWDIPDRSGESR